MKDGLEGPSLVLLGGCQVVHWRLAASVLELLLGCGYVYNTVWALGSAASHGLFIWESQTINLTAVGGILNIE